MRRSLLVVLIIGCSDPVPRPQPAPVDFSSYRVYGTREPPPPPPPPAPEPACDNLPFLGVSPDHAHALFSDDLDFAVVAIATGTTEATLHLSAFAKLPRETLADGGGEVKLSARVDDPALADDLREAAPVLAPFPSGVGRLAAAADGKHVAFNFGDWIYTAFDGELGKRLSHEASYDPMFSPDGHTLVFRREHGTGIYELFATSSDGSRPPQAIAGTRELTNLTLTDRGTWRALSGRCIVDVGVTAPYPIRRLGCFAGHEDVTYCQFSPAGTWVACGTRTMEVATGKRGRDLSSNSVFAISDRGVAIVETTDYQTYLAHAIDPGGHDRVVREAPTGLRRAAFVSPTRLVYDAGCSRIATIDLSTSSDPDPAPPHGAPAPH